MVDPNLPSPKHQQLKEYLKNLIFQGKLTPGEQLPSENSLARQFKISRHTVRQSFGELEQEGLIYREQGRGTFCNPLKRPGGQNIAVLTTYISDYIFPSIIQGIEAVLSDAGYNLLLANSNNNKTKEAQCLENLVNQDIVAMIIEPAKSAKANSNLTYFQTLTAKGVPYLMLHAHYPELDQSFIVIDDEQGGYLETKYLLQLGHRRIAGVFKTDDQQGVKRLQGFRRALNEYGLIPPPELVGTYETEQLHSFPYHFSQRLLLQPERPTAIVCYNDQIALEVLEVVRNEGLRVPDDLSLVAFDDSSLATATEIKLTTVKHPKLAMGHQAAQSIVDMLTGSIDQPRRVYAPELIIRNSCRNI